MGVISGIRALEKSYPQAHISTPARVRQPLPHHQLAEAEWRRPLPQAWRAPPGSPGFPSAGFLRRGLALLGGLNPALCDPPKYHSIPCC